MNNTLAIDAVLKTALKTVESLDINHSQPQPSEVIKTLQNLVGNIIVSSNELKITLKFDQLIAKAKALCHAPDLVWECCDWQSLRHKIILPVLLKRSGLNVRLIVQPPQYEMKRNVDVRMVKLLSRAHHYFNLLTTGKVSSFKEIGILEKLSSSQVSRVTLFAFLSPDIVRKILDGKHPPSLTSDKLMKSLPLPTDWNEQRQVLGFH